MGVADQILRDVEEQRKINLPYSIFNTEGVKELNRILHIRSYMGLSRFYSTIYKYVDEKNFELLKKGLKRKRKISDEDSMFIDRLIEIKRKDSLYFLDYLGNQMYLNEVTDAVLNMKKPRKRVLIVSLMLWIYINMVEFLARFISELLLEYINENDIISKSSKKNRKYYQSFIKKFNDGEHPTLGLTIRTAELLGFMTASEKSLFNSQRFIRNKIAHSNIFYDSKRKAIAISDGTVYELKGFKKDYHDLQAFLNHFLYRSLGTYDIGTRMKEELETSGNKISKRFRSMARNSFLRKNFFDFIHRKEVEERKQNSRNGKYK
ncbi:MAG: hypothetical protein ACOC32_00370 [Nanoarchaeota archaeon]